MKKYCPSGNFLVDTSVVAWLLLLTLVTELLWGKPIHSRWLSLGPLGQDAARDPDLVDQDPLIPLATVMVQG